MILSARPEPINALRSANIERLKWLQSL